jgi:hypothetical protein
MPKTQQAEGGSPKVAMFKGPSKGRWHQFIDACHERRTRESGEYEVEDFIPVSALVSDEATEAVLASEEVANELRRVVRASDEESLDEAAAYFLRAVFQAAIDHLGGTDAH